MLIKAPYLRVFLVTAALGISSGCQTSNGVVDEPFELQPGLSGQVREDLPLVWQQSGTYSRVNRRLRVVARDMVTLARLPLTEVPVDFKTQMVLIAAQGPVPGDQVGIRITRVWREGSRIRVQEQPLHPGSQHTDNFLDLASPWTVVVVPRSDLNVEGYETRAPAGALSDKLRRR